jgi:HEAT repeat protein
LAFGTVSDPFVALALWAGLAALAASGALVAAVAALRLQLRVLAGRDARFERAWQDVFAARAAGPEQAPPPSLAPADRERFLQLFNRYQGSVRGEARDRLNHLAAECGVVAHARRQLGARDLARRLVAVRAVGYLRDAAAAPALGALAADANPVVSLLAERALLDIEGPAALPGFLARTAKREDWPLARVAGILAERGPAEVSLPIVAAVRAATAAGEAGAARLVRLLDCGTIEHTASTVAELLSGATDPELLTAALSALRDPAGLERVRALAGHAQWFVRVEAVKALSRLGMEPDRLLLLRMLADPSWWVRYRAAQALAALPGSDAGYLRSVRSALPDPFAADMLAQVIAEKGAA